jgi:hypothetical protein
VENYVTKENVQRFTAMIDVKKRDHHAHPNLDPHLLIRKLFLIRRAAFESGQMGLLNDIHICIQMALSVTGQENSQQYIDIWRQSGISGWGAFKEEDYLPYDDLL